MKICSKCGSEKQVNEFYARKTASDGFDSWCKECSKARVRKHYHLRSESLKKKHKEYIQANRFKAALSCAATYAKRKKHMPCLATEAEIQSAFTGLCDICGVPEIECNKKLCMDHNHDTGEFRGWLCSACNKGLGFFTDSEERIIDALHYLMNSKGSLSFN